MGADIYNVIYLCSCSCCSKLRGASLQKSWQLAGLLAKTLAFWARREIGIVVQDNYYSNGFIIFELIILEFH